MDDEKTEDKINPEAEPIRNIMHQSLLATHP